MSAGTIADYLADLDAALPAPRRSKRTLLVEARDGLHDAAAAYEAGGLPASAAERAAVADFGAVHLIAPLYRQELAVRQMRRTCRKLSLTLPTLFLAWQALLTTSRYGSPPAHGRQVLTIQLAGVAAATAVLAAIALPLAGRLGSATGRLSRLLPRVIGTAAIVGVAAAACGLATLLSQLPAAAPAPTALAVVSALALAATAWSGAACQRTARLASPASARL